ncbi:hypothetical protein [Aminobacter sp. MDW-2]|uniref:hypothetical protein n=1 Tax=Aminobacter sp. MDW-2 TaxID=2666139 RepID=UPI0012B11674|nr:hypothetical protein [Aminobacter sp. MDW-2]MRX31886.1 hypothetical protein [Aminobacter sp. MDW-2]QNH32362.1 hypothetical protein H5P29_17570 [Aminobacter sp. MDW-2]
MTYVLDIVAKRDGHTFGFHREVEAETYSDAHKTTRESLIRDGWVVVKVRRDVTSMTEVR